MKKESASIIGGADGPTSIFIAGKADKRPVSERIKRYLYRKKRNRIEKKIIASSHTMEEVIEYLQSQYGAEEVSVQSRMYVEMKNGLKEGLVVQYKPELLGEMSNLQHPKGDDDESLKEFWKQIELRSKMIETISEKDFPMDYRIYEIKYPDGGSVQIDMEKHWGCFGVSYSGNKRELEELRKISKEIYVYYGVTDEDIQKKTRRYQSLVTALCL